MIRRPPRSTLDRSSAASDVYKRQPLGFPAIGPGGGGADIGPISAAGKVPMMAYNGDSVRYFTIHHLSLIHISEPTRPY